MVEDGVRLFVLQVRMPGKDPWLVGVYSRAETLLAAAEAYRRVEEGLASDGPESWFWKCLEVVLCDLDRLPLSVAGGAFQAKCERPLSWVGERARLG